MLNGGVKTVLIKFLEQILVLTTVVRDESPHSQKVPNWGSQVSRLLWLLMSGDSQVFTRYY